ncbi:MAG: creatininase family protein [Chloroflexota bacterium]
MKVRLSECTWQELAARRAEVQDTIIIPIGSTEQHGYHLPLGTDTFAAISLAEAVAEREDVLIAPPLYYGWSPHHMVLPGTITIRPEVLTELVYDVIESLAAHGFRRFVLLNGHRIVNITWLQVAAERAKRQLGVKAVIADPAYLSKTLVRQGLGKLGHADEIETSHMLVSYPDLVHMDRAVDYVHTTPPYVNVDPSCPDDVLCYVPSAKADMQASVEHAGGTNGAPSRASAEKGRRYFDWCRDRLAQIVSDLKQGRL